MTTASTMLVALMIVDQSELPPRSIAQSKGSQTRAPLVTHEAFIHLDCQAALTPKVGLHLNRRNGRVEATLHACAWGEVGIGRRTKYHKAWQGVLRAWAPPGLASDGQDHCFEYVYCAAPLSSSVSQGTQSGG